MIPMNTSAGNRRIELEQGATVAVIGGGPAGAFFAIHLLRKSRHLGREIKVTIFERRRSVAATAPACLAGNWKGCNYCAGGISPRLNRLLQDLDLRLPPDGGRFLVLLHRPSVSRASKGYAAKSDPNLDPRTG